MPRGSTKLEELLAEIVPMADARHVPPRAPEWAVPLDPADYVDR